MHNSASHLLLHDYLALAESYRAAIRYTDALAVMDAASQSHNFARTPADLNFIQLRKLDYQIEYRWLYNSLHADFLGLQSQLIGVYHDAQLRHDRAQIAYAAFLKARFHFFAVEISPDYEMIEQLWKKAISYYQRVPDRRGMAESLFYRGLLYQQVHVDQEKAYTYFQYAYRLIENRNHPLELAQILRHTGYVYQQRGDLDRAYHCHESALALLQEINFRVYMPPTHCALGMVLLEQGHLDQAEPHFEKALAVAQEAPPNILHVGALMGLGDYYAKAADPARARDYYQRAQDTASALQATRFIKMASDKLAALPT